MLRRANEHESAAFSLVERALRRTRPRVGARGLEAVILPTGKIERGLLGRLRVRFDGKSSDWDSDNGPAVRPPSNEETSQWYVLSNVVDAAGPVVDAQWNLVSMRIGPRVLSRLPMGGLVTFVPNGTPPFKGSLDVVVTEPRPAPGLSLPSVSAREALLLRAIDAFLRERDATPWERAQLVGRSIGPAAARRPWFHGMSAPLVRGPNRARRKWHKCPICHRPVVKHATNMRIIHGTIRAGTGTIRDLRGGYMSRLRETYLIAGPESVIEPQATLEEAVGDPPDQPAHEPR